MLVFSLFAGLILAVVIQLLLTTLGIALGLTVLDLSPSDKGVTPSPQSSPSEQSLPITHLLGLGVAFSLSMVMFAAAFIATDFSQIDQPRQGGIFGLIFWATYWLLFIGLSSTTLSGIVDSVLGLAVAGGRQLVSAIRQTLDVKAPESSEGAPANQSMLRELAAQISQIVNVQQQLPELLANQREILVAEICDRTDLSSDQAESILQDLESKEETQSIVPTIEPPSSQPISAIGSSSNVLSQLDLPSWQQVLQRVLDRIDLSDWDAETLWRQFQSLQDPSSTSGVPQVIEAHIRSAPVWLLKPEVIKEELNQSLDESQIVSNSIQTQLGSLKRNHFVDWLQARGDLAVEQIEDLADQLSHIQDSGMTGDLAHQEGEKLRTATEAIQTAVEEIQTKLIAYCRYTNLDSLTPEGLEEKVNTQLEAHPSLKESRPKTFDVEAIDAVLSRRRGLKKAQKQALLKTLQSVWPSDLEGNDQQSAVDYHDPSFLERTSQRFEGYLQSIDWSTVSLEDLKPEMQAFLEKLQSGDRLLDWRDISSRIQIPASLKTELLDWLGETQSALIQSPRPLALGAGQAALNVSDQLKTQISRYLRYQDKSAFAPKQIPRDLAQIARGILRSLPHLSDLSELVDLGTLWDKSAWQQELEKRRDMTTDEIQQILNWCESAWEGETQRIRTWVHELWSEATSLLNFPDTNPLDAVRQQVVEQIAATQQSLKEKAMEVTEEFQEQADAARRQVAIAAWWLFASLLLSGVSAASAAWLAVSYLD